MQARSPTGVSPPRPVRGAVYVVGGVALAAACQAARVWRQLQRWRAHAARLRSTWVTIPAVAGSGRLRIHARTGGDASPSIPPIVLVHGYGIATSYFVPLASTLAREALVLAPDLPGHGRSDHDARPLTIVDQAGALGTWLGACRLDGVLLVGHSLGCQIATELAVRRPALVRGLVLVGPTCAPEARSALRLVARALPTALHECASFYVLAAADYARAGVRLLASEMREMTAHRLEDRLPGVCAPVRVARGEHDHIAPARWVEEVARLARAPVPATIAGWGHAAQFGAPGPVARLVLAFARTV